jgi:epoxyqueuosine reductase
MPAEEKTDFEALALRIKAWGHALGFQQVGIGTIDLGEDEARLVDWLREGMHGEMDYMARHGTRRSRPAELVPGTIRVISARMDYMPEAAPTGEVLERSDLGYVSRYALGRDYHRLIRGRLARLCRKIAAAAGGTGHRAFVDSAPVLEKALARNAGLGWIGKHTNLIHPRAGSWFFLGEIYTDLPLPVDAPFTRSHCGSCSACMSACPTGAIVGPYRLDARRCISYLTIELKGPIPVHLRALVGNRIYGCDDCQLVCPWNRFARLSAEKDFSPRHGLDAAELTTLFGWDDAEFRRRTEGSAIRRIGHERWLRNVAVALGNAPRGEAIVGALRSRESHPSELVREHVRWALEKQNVEDGI